MHRCDVQKSSIVVHACLDGRNVVRWRHEVRRHTCLEKRVGVVRLNLAKNIS